MGWKRGRSIKDSSVDSLYDARREARKAFLAFSSEDAKAKLSESGFMEDGAEGSSEQPVDDENHSSRGTSVHVLNPKQDLYGLGYDPYKHAPEFRDKKRARMSSEREQGTRKSLQHGGSLFGFKSGKAAPGFGIGALEEFDVEDEDVYTTAYDFEDTFVKEIEEPSRSSGDQKPRLGWKEQGVIRGFKAASHSDFHLERFDPPVVPKDFVPHHKFPGPLKVDQKHDIPPPPEVAAPEDSNLKLLIEGVASIVARCGKLFEDLSREKNRSNPLFSFLDGRNGYEYYTRKLWEQQQKHGDQKKLILTTKSLPRVEKMTAESRGKILGEKPLERSSRDLSSSVSEVEFNLNLNLSDTFTKSASYDGMPEVSKPFKDDPGKQARFERFLTEKYQGGLRTTDSGGSSNMSEAARARERLDFEAAAEAIEKGKSAMESKLSLDVMGFSGSRGMQFTSGGAGKLKDAEADNIALKDIYPRREEFPWRPLPILCKRFDLIDPYMGKPPPPPRMKSKLDSLISLPDSVKAKNVEGTVPSHRDLSSVFQSSVQETSSGTDTRDIEAEVKVENVERPVDLYKAIFSDDSDDDYVEASNATKADEPEKKIEVAQTTLNRLIAGDFLESLGKELGFEVPPDRPYLPNMGTSVTQKGTTAYTRNVSTNQVETKMVSTGSTSDVVLSDQTHLDDKTGQRGETPKNGQKNVGSSVASLEMMVHKDEKLSSPPVACRHRKRSINSSEDERSRKHSGKQQHEDSDSLSDSSSEDYHHSRSRRRKERSSREKKRSRRRHSKHHKHGSRHSPSRYSHVSKKEYQEGKREKGRRKD